MMKPWAKQKRNMFNSGQNSHSKFLEYPTKEFYIQDLPTAQEISIFGKQQSRG